MALSVSMMIFLINFLGKISIAYWGPRFRIFICSFVSEKERIIELGKACRKGKLMNCCESLYIQEYHRKGYLITEQLKHEHNILFDHVSTTLPTKYSDTALTAEDEHRPNHTVIT